MKLKLLLLFIFHSIIIVHSSYAVEVSFWDNIPHKQLAAQIAAEMTDEELLAQTFMFGWAGAEPSGLLKKWITENGLGSIKIFGWNTHDSYKLAESIAMLQKMSLAGRFSIPLFVATDQEGGSIRHVKGLSSETPGNLAIGASGIPKDAYYSGYYISKELRALGININFAPTIDLYTNRDSTIIGTRSFGENPEEVGKLGEAFMRGSLDAGILATAKHFPGHGGTAVDSHGKLPKINISERTFYTRELIPFKRLINAGIPLVMTGHLNFPAIMRSEEPATFSYYLLNTLLRRKLGFDGLVVTDDMMMHGALSYAGNIAKAIQMALQAGNDIIESSNTPLLTDEAWVENLDLMKTDPIFKARVTEAVLNILYFKLKYFKSPNHAPIIPNLKKIEEEVPNKEGQMFFMGLAARSATLVCSNGIPYKPCKDEKIMLVSRYKAFFDAGKKRLPSAAMSGLSGFLNNAEYADTIIFCLSDDYSLEILQYAIKKFPEKKYIVISSLSPVYLSSIKNISTAIAVYSYSPVSFTAAFAVLMGDFIPTGVMPLSGIVQ